MIGLDKLFPQRSTGDGSDRSVLWTWAIQSLVEEIPLERYIFDFTIIFFVFRKTTSRHIRNC